jgi:DNA-directed RNA polymerase specialized sigma24 family protein
VAVDEAEFSEFFASQYGPLCWLGLLLTGSRTQAEELAQEALVRTWWRWQLVGRPAEPASYARRVLVNRHRSLRRHTAVQAGWLARSQPLEQEVAPPADHERALVLWQAVGHCRHASGRCWCCASTRTSPRHRWRSCLGCRWAR